MRSYLVDLREKHGESQQDVADALGISRQYYQMIETGERQKKMDTTLVIGIAQHFSVSAAEIIECEQTI